MKVRGLILAAGEGSRLGQPKALCAVGAETFLERLCRVFGVAGVRDIVAVVGGTHATVSRAEAERLRVQVCHNPDPSDGPISSIRAGIELGDTEGSAEDSGERVAWLIHPVDIPGVEVDDVRALLESARREGWMAIQPEVTGRRVHPVLVCASQRSALKCAKHLREFLGGIEACSRWTVPSANPWLRFDVDTPEDLAELQRGFGP